MIIVLFHRIDPPDRGRDKPHSAWCVLRCAVRGSHVTSLCCFEFPYRALDLLTVDLADHDARLPRNLCRQCRTELAAKTPGAAQCLEPVRDLATLESRVSTVDLRPGRGGERAADEEWSETGIPEVVLRDMTSRGVAV